MRNLSAAMITAAADSILRPVYFVELQFPSAPLYLTDLGSNMAWDSRLWLGNGWLRPVKSVDESPDIRATGAEITLCGCDSQIVALAMNESRQTNKGRVWLGFLDENENLIASPYMVFSGNLDTTTIQQSDSDFLVTLKFESDLMGLNRQKEFRYTDESQKALFPGDRGFQYVALMEDWDGYWGKPEKPKWYTQKRKRNR